MLIHHRALRVAAAIAATVLLSMAFASPAAAQQCGPMDVVFIIDETGSMTNVIANIQAQVAKIADEVVKASGGTYSFALVGMPDNNVDVILNPSPNNRADLTTAVGKLATSGGCGGVPYDEAINGIINKLGARTGSDGGQLNAYTGTFTAQTKIVILITDTLPQGFTCVFTPGVHDKAAHDFASTAATKDIHITSLYVPTGNQPEATIIAIMQDVATTSGGLYKTAKSDASDLSDIILDIIQACGGAAGGTSSSNLLIEPTEIVLTNGETGQVKITNFAPGTTTSTVYSAEPAEEGEFTTTFSAPTHPADAPGTEVVTLSITVGPNTFQGTHLVAVRATNGAAEDFAVVHVIVDCQPPFFLGTGNPQNTNVTRGSTANLKASAGGDGPIRYQWYRGHTGITSFPIPGATLSQLTTEAITTSSEFWVRASNACGSRDSASAFVNPN